MNEQNEKLTELQSIIETAVSYHNDRLFSSFDSLLSNAILPAWRTVLLELCGTIEQFHLVAAGDGDSKHEPDFIVHYTSVATLVSMFQGEVDRNKHQANGGDTTSTPKEGQRFKGGQRSSLRLYDSAHFNDPARVTIWLATSVTTRKASGYNRVQQLMHTLRRSSSRMMAPLKHGTTLSFGERTERKAQVVL